MRQKRGKYRTRMGRGSGRKEREARRKEELGGEGIKRGR